MNAESSCTPTLPESGTAVLRPRNGAARRLFGAVPVAAPAVLATTVRDWWQRWRSRRELHAMDARMLRDIGLTAEARRDETRKWFWQV